MFQSHVSLTNMIKTSRMELLLKSPKRLKTMYLFLMKSRLSTESLNLENQRMKIPMKRPLERIKPLEREKPLKRMTLLRKMISQRKVMLLKRVMLLRTLVHKEDCKMRR